jgi:hypothetical protein
MSPLSGRMSASRMGTRHLHGTALNLRKTLTADLKQRTRRCLPYYSTYLQCSLQRDCSSFQYPTMAVLSLPLSFTNSFWTPDYRKGLEVLFAKLEEVLSFCFILAICFD